MIQGHRGREGVGGPKDALRVGVMSIDHRDEPELPKARFTTMELDQRCVGCPWELTCFKDRTCWRLEPWHFEPTGVLQARAVREPRPRGRTKSRRLPGG